MGCENLLGYFFEMGPVTQDGPLGMQEVRSWAEPLAGRSEWEPWQARLFVQLSRAYCAEQHRAQDYYAAPPIPEAINMWQWVRNQKAERRLDQDEAAVKQRMKEAQKNDNR